MRPVRVRVMHVRVVAVRLVVVWPVAVRPMSVLQEERSTQDVRNKKRHVKYTRRSGWTTYRVVDVRVVAVRLVVVRPVAVRAGRGFALPPLDPSS